MPTKKRRTRTGCLTCRARRIKCDEGVPKCRRCVRANIECAGYEPRRAIPIVQSPVSGSGSKLSKVHSEDSFAGDLLHSIAPCKDANSGTIASRLTETDRPIPFYPRGQMPLVGLPSNPHRDQRLVLGAKHLLGYHQVLLRTVPLLFEPEHLSFWRDELFQKAWSCEYLYLTLVALGSLHRAALMIASTEERDNNNGLDIKITAVHVYTEALQELSNHLDEAKETPTLLVAVLCLMAYFEALSGNIPAFIGRVQAANYYFTTLILAHDDGSSNDSSQFQALASLQSSLRSLGQTCYIALPVQRLHATAERYMNSLPCETDDQQRKKSISLSDIQSLVNLVSQDQDIEAIVWNPLAAYARHTPVRVISSFEARLREWRNRYLHLVPDLDSDSALNYLLIYKWEKMPMPPPPYESTARIASLIAAHYNFFMARAKWALLLLGNDTQQNHLSAGFYFYEALRHVASCAQSSIAEQGMEDGYIPCEALRLGLLPILHITALCSPQPTWLLWIKELCDNFVQEGILKGHTFATNLVCLHVFEVYQHGGPQSSMEWFPEPEKRIICQLIPETDGRHYTSYFAAPKPGSDFQDGLCAYHVIGHAKWMCSFGEHPCTPDIKFYDEKEVFLETLSEDWLHSTQPAREWMSWSQEVDFRMDRALQDHINGTRLLLAADEIAGLTEKKPS